MSQKLNEYWVTKTYLLDEIRPGKNFMFFMGLSEVSMQAALATSLGTHLITDVTVAMESDTRWHCTGMIGSGLEGCSYLVEQRVGCPTLPVKNYSIWDNRITAHKENRKELPDAKQLTFC